MPHVSEAIEAAAIASAIMLAMVWGLALALIPHAEPRVRRNVMLMAVVISIACVVILAAVVVVVLAR